jgi:siroheme decarboxylase
MAAIETPGTGSGSAPPTPRGSQHPDDTGAAPTSDAGRRAGRTQPDDTGAARTSDAGRRAGRTQPDDTGAARTSDAGRRAGRTQPDDTGAARTSEAGRRAGRTPVPKLRSRKEGAAIALDDLDKRLLNLMQGQFPIAPRPYQHVASAAELPEAEVLSRVQRLLDERIIRQVTPIFDTRALGYASMLVAAKVDAENPWRAANIINTHPGVSHNYLRNHEFNIWFTIATEPDSPLGLEGTLEVLARLAGAESVRQLPTLKLFKIRMDLEMEAGTEALSKVTEAAAPAETEAQPYDDFDRAVIRATQGDLPVVPEPYAPAAAKLGIGVEQLLEHLRGMQERRLLRRVAAILFHRRAGFSANGMGVWKVPDERIMELGMRMASFRGISHCYERPTYADWPYSVFTMAHGRSKDECDAILDSIAADTGIEERATLYSSTEFKKIRLLYFTEDYRAWEREHAGV